MERHTLYIDADVDGREIRQRFHLDAVSDIPGLTIAVQETLLAAGKRVTVRLYPSQKVILKRLFLTASHGFASDERVMVNGYQSWTESREYGIRERQPGLNRWLRPLYRKYRLPLYGDAFFWPYSNRRGIFHSHTYTYIRDAEKIDFYGSLAEQSGYTIIQINTRRGELEIHKDCAGLEIAEPFLAFDLFFSAGAEGPVFDAYFDALGVPEPGTVDLTGWTSWYHYYTHIDARIIHDNLMAFATRSIPIDIFQIDDGWQQAVGDWLDVKETFPGGMKPVAEAIHTAGYRAGLWLAPFVCEEKSRLFRDHPQWVARDESGQPVVAGYSDGWSGHFYALDLTQQDVRAYLLKVFAVVLGEWGFDMLKLDFLYAAALTPTRNKTRGRLMSEAMVFLREIAGEKQILGCGVPLGSAFGRVDCCRIGGDIALQWEDRRLRDLIRYRERVDTLASLTNTISRRQLHRRGFINDPDVFLLRDRNIDMNAAQRRTLFMLNLVFGGLLFTSDNIAEYDAATLRLYCAQFPLRPRQVRSVSAEGSLYRIAFSSGESEYVVAANLGRRPVTAALPEGVFFADGRYQTDSLRLPPYATICLRRIPGPGLALLGTSGHIFPGMEIDQFEHNADRIILKIAPEALHSTTVYIQVPDGLDAVWVGDTRCRPRIQNGRPVVAVTIDRPPALIKR